MSAVPPSEEVMRSIVADCTAEDVTDALAAGMIAVGADIDVARTLAAMHIDKLRADAWDEGAADMAEDLELGGSTRNPYRS